MVCSGCAKEDERSAVRAAEVKTEKEMVERCAALVPTTWLDPLLTGPNAAEGLGDCRGLQKLLRAIRDRILAELDGK